MRSLAKQSAIVTGAGRGIGRAIALRLAAEGARVTLLARSQGQLDSVAAEIHAQGGMALPVATDVTDARAVARAAQAAEATFGSVSVLVNNAGVPGPFGPICTVDPQEWWSAQQIHVFGPLLLMHAVIPGMRARGGGRIINIVSSAGTQAIAHLSAYAVGKSTLIRLTETVDLEQRSGGVRAFALHPGTITTDMARDTIASPDAHRWVPEGVAMLAARTPEDSAADLARCLDAVMACAAGQRDALAGRYLDIDRDFPPATHEAQ